MKDATCVNPKCKAVLVLIIEFTAGMMATKPAWDTITCPVCGHTFDIPPVPGKITNVLVKS